MATFKSMVKEHIRFLLNMQAIGFMDIFWSACRMELIGSNKLEHPSVHLIMLSLHVVQAVRKM